MKVLLTGANGLIGSRVSELLKGYELIGISVGDFDITDLDATDRYVKDLKPEVIIHLAGYTNTEQAEIDKELCWKVNVTGTENLLKAASDQKAKFIFLSTDHTFSGEKGDYVETDPQEPVNYYGETKLAGEKLVLDYDNSLVLRTSYPFRANFPTKTDILRFMIPKLKVGEEVELVSDQQITPTFIDDLAVVFDKCIKKDLKGVYHSGGGSCLTIFEMGQVVADQFGFDTNLVKRVTYQEFVNKTNRKAKQPLKSCLNSSKLQTETGLIMKSFPDALKIIKEQLL